MKILVTGSNGCVGSALASECKDDSREWIFSTRQDCNLTSRKETIDYFLDLKPDYIVHLASYVPGFYSINAVDSFTTNVQINENVLAASNLAGIERGMFCLSVNMFPENPSKFPIDESQIFEGSLAGPFAGYGYSKRMLAHSLQNYNQQYGRKYFGIIPCNVYGLADNYTSGRLIPNLILKFREVIKNNKEIASNADVVINGTGKPLRQFIFSRDLARIIKCLVTEYTDDTVPVICAPDQEITIEELARTIARVMNFTGQIKFDTTKQDGNLKKTADSSWLKSIMPDFEFTSLEEGLRETINSGVA